MGTLYVASTSGQYTSTLSRECVLSAALIVAYHFT